MPAPATALDRVVVGASFASPYRRRCWRGCTSSRWPSWRSLVTGYCWIAVRELAQRERPGGAARLGALARDEHLPARVPGRTGARRAGLGPRHHRLEHAASRSPRWPPGSPPHPSRPRAGRCAPARSTSGPSEHGSEPELAIEPEPRQGPVLVTVEYRVPAERAAAFRGAMERVGRSRRRSGAERWGLWQDGARARPLRRDLRRAHLGGAHAPDPGALHAQRPALRGARRARSSPRAASRWCRISSSPIRAERRRDTIRRTTGGLAGSGLR